LHFFHVFCILFNKNNKEINIISELAYMQQESQCPREISLTGMIKVSRG
jgi:hypothetical protein